jgi:hypothetical protein
MLLDEEFPVAREIQLWKFPVPLRREFGWKLLNSPVDWAPKLERTDGFGKIPCIFPC